jgi:DNA-binding protein H-NS
LRVEDKYSDTEKKVEVLEIVIWKFEKLAVEKPKSAEIIKYLITQLQDKLNSYDDGFSEIEDILNDF